MSALNRVAVVQASSIPFQAEPAVDKAVQLIAKAGAEGAKLALFPEAFIGGYPKGCAFATPVGMRLPGSRDSHSAGRREAARDRIVELGAREHAADLSGRCAAANQHASVAQPNCSRVGPRRGHRERFDAVPLRIHVRDRRLGNTVACTGAQSGREEKR
jgi:hypothetical protein